MDTEKPKTNVKTDTSIPLQSRGGIARAEKLSAEDRSEIARFAADSRWNKEALEKDRPILPKATHTGTLKIGTKEIPCAVLQDGTRLITQSGMFVALERHPFPSIEREALVDKPAFLAASNLNSFISNELRRSWTPKFFKTTKGGGYKGNIAIGYDAKILPMICEVYLKAREFGILQPQQKKVAKAAEVILMGLATVGIIALVDEATGYQEIRDRLALQEILKKYISDALLEWTKTFPDEFFKEIFRLKNWEWKNHKFPSVIGRYVNDLVYERLQRGVLDELRKKNPVTEKGYRQHKHHQWLTRDIGHPALTHHLYRILGMMEASNSWEEFKHKIDAKLPRLNKTMELDLDGA